MTAVLPEGIKITFVDEASDWPNLTPEKRERMAASMKRLTTLGASMNTVQYAIGRSFEKRVTPKLTTSILSES